MSSPNTKHLLVDKITKHKGRLPQSGGIHVDGVQDPLLVHLAERGRDMLVFTDVGDRLLDHVEVRRAPLDHREA